MPGAGHQMAAAHIGQAQALHALKIAGLLVHAPISRAADETGRHADGLAGEELHLPPREARGGAAIALQAALEAGAGIFLGVNRNLGLGEPAIGGDLGGRGHFRRHRLGHALGQIHDVIGGHFGDHRRIPARQRMRAVGRPIGAFVMVICAEEGVQPGRMGHQLGIGAGRRVMPLVMLARPRQGCEGGIHRR